MRRAEPNRASTFDDELLENPLRDFVQPKRHSTFGMTVTESHTAFDVDEDRKADQRSTRLHVRQEDRESRLRENPTSVLVWAILPMGLPAFASPGAIMLLNIFQYVRTHPWPLQNPSRSVEGKILGGPP